MEEVWKDIPGYEGRYYASNLGRIKYVNHKPLTLRTYNKSMYYKVNLVDANGVKKCWRVHQLIYITFNGPIPENLVIDHIDGCRTNNVISNLRVVSVKENCNNPVTKDNYFKRYHRPGEKDRRSAGQRKRFAEYTENEKAWFGQLMVYKRNEKKYANISVDCFKK